MQEASGLIPSSAKTTNQDVLPLGMSFALSKARKSAGKEPQEESLARKHNVCILVALVRKPEGRSEGRKIVPLFWWLDWEDGVHQQICQMLGGSEVQGWVNKGERLDRKLDEGRLL